ncbi:MAG: DNA-binding protein HU [Candidatus Aminicenantes bacterium 4484_214]|nr:MAG: DNA-binding protein HU [Candidatus Aminicenantes bacterium 4484_214]RLE11009.1 MAG: DNA-binding protein HU [Candidatus Aminicenantes bacterium]HDJ23523.1 HU family DNA-binding protein [Candidatus Aminicenantes bacterium]
MNKRDIISKMSKDAGITLDQAKKALAALIQGVSTALQRGERVTLSGFGSFEIKLRQERMGRNPKTGKIIKISAKRKVKFNPSQQLENSL